MPGRGPSRSGGWCSVPRLLLDRWRLGASRPAGPDAPVNAGAGAQQRLDRAPLVHRAVALGGFVERQGEVEDLAGVDRAVADELDQLGQETAHRGRAAVQVHAGEEQRLTGQLDAVSDADVADVPA